MGAMYGAGALAKEEEKTRAQLGLPSHPIPSYGAIPDAGRGVEGAGLGAGSTTGGVVMHQVFTPSQVPSEPTTALILRLATSL